MNNNLRNLQSSIQIALDDPQITPKQIAEIVRETLRIEASKARDAADKAEEALSELEPDTSSFGDITFSSFAADSVNMNYLSSGSDVLTF